MLAGDIVKHILAPFVKGTALEHCGGCEKRRQWMNRANEKILTFITILLCPCTWKYWFNRK